MDMLYLLLIILGILAAIALIIKIVLPHLASKGIDVKAALDKAANAAATASKALEALRPFIKDSVDVNILDKIMAAAHAGVGNAEQLYHIGQLKPEERNAAAKDYIAKTLKLANIEVTPEIEVVINSALESSVLDLGHKPGAEG